MRFHQNKIVTALIILIALLVEIGAAKSEPKKLYKLTYRGDIEVKYKGMEGKEHTAYLKSMHYPTIHFSYIGEVDIPKGIHRMKVVGECEKLLTKAEVLGKMISDVEYFCTAKEVYFYK